MRISVKQKCFQFVLERVQQDVCRPQFAWQAIPYSWSTDREAAVTITLVFVRGMASWRVLADRSLLFRIINRRLFC